MSDYFDQRRGLIDARLTELAIQAATPTALRGALTQALTSKGKRVRGLLAIACAEALGVKPTRVVDAAVAFEMIHTSSLILDDLPAMDDAETRRGEPTLHRAFGEDLAILASVALLNEAYGLLSRTHSQLSPRRWKSDRFLQRVVDAVGWNGTIGGEAVDLHSESSALDFATLEYIHSRKTGALFVAAAAVGGMLGNCSEPTLRSLESYAKNLGLAFQISDDILDVVGDRDMLGKDTGKDQQRLTFVKLAGIEGARQLNHELIDASLAALVPLGSGAQRLRELALLLRDRMK